MKKVLYCIAVVHTHFELIISNSKKNPKNQTKTTHQNPTLKIKQCSARYFSFLGELNYLCAAAYSISICGFNIMALNFSINMELQLHKKISFIWVVCILVFGAWKLLIVLSQIPSAQLMGSCGCSPTALNLKPRLQLCFVTDFLMSTSSAHELPTASKDLFASLYSWNKSYQCNYCRVMENLLNSLLKGEIQSRLVCVIESIWNLILII